MLPNALQKEKNVLVNAVKLTQCSRLLIAIILLISDCHISFQFVEMLSNLHLTSCQLTTLSFP